MPSTIYCVLSPIWVAPYVELVIAVFSLFWPAVNLPSVTQQCYTVTMLHCYNVTMLQCYTVTMLQCYNVTMLQCYNVTMLQCYNVSLLHCFTDTMMPQWEVSSFNFSSLNSRANEIKKFIERQMFKFWRIGVVSMISASIVVKCSQ